MRGGDVQRQSGTPTSWHAADRTLATLQEAILNLSLKGETGNELDSWKNNLVKGAKVWFKVSKMFPQ